MADPPSFFSMKHVLWLLLLGLSACSRAGGKTSEADTIDLADRAWCRGDTVQAQSLLGDLLKHHPKSFPALYRMAIFPIDGEPEVALERLTDLARLNPKHPGPVFYAGLARMRLNDFTRAEEDMRRGYALAEKRRGYALDDTSAAAREGLSEYRSGHYQAAAAALGRAVAAEPDNAILWFLEGRAALSAGDVDGATEAVGKALAKRESFPSAHALKAEILRLKKQGGDARQEVGLALKDDPENAEALYQLGLLDLDDAEVRAAAIDLWRAVLADPTFAPAHQALGQTFMHMEQARQGMPFYQHYEWVLGFLSRNSGRS
jgi:tetratricopeptide (TPR) repeat protein